MGSFFSQNPGQFLILDQQKLGKGDQKTIAFSTKCLHRDICLFLNMLKVQIYKELEGFQAEILEQMPL